MILLVEFTTLMAMSRELLQLLFDREKQHRPIVSPDGTQLAYIRAEETGHEIVIQTLESGCEHQLTNGQLQDDVPSPLVWHPDGDRIYFHRYEDKEPLPYDVHELSLDGASQCVVAKEGRCLLRDISSSGRYLLVWQYTEGAQPNWIHRHDLHTGTTSAILETESVTTRSRFSPDGELVAYHDSETSDSEPKAPSDDCVRVGYADGGVKQELSVGNSDTTTLFRDWHPTTAKLLLADDTKPRRRAVIYDLVNNTLHWFGDGETEENPRFFLPDGSGFVSLRVFDGGTRKHPVVFTADGHSYELDLKYGYYRVPVLRRQEAFVESDPVFAGSTATDPETVFHYNLETGECSGMLSADVDTSQATLVSPDYVTFDSADGVTVGALYYPAASDGPSPGVVLVHGGPHTCARRRFTPEVPFLINEGYHVIRPNYRGSEGRGAEFANAIIGDWGGGEQDDIEAAGRWLGDREGVDENRLAIVGHSYGGYTALLQALNRSERWAAAVPWNPAFRPEAPDPCEYADGVDSKVALLFLYGEHDGSGNLISDVCGSLRKQGWRQGPDKDYVEHELVEQGHGSHGVRDEIQVWGLIGDFLNRQL